MAAAGESVGSDITLYRAAVISTKDESNIETLISGSGNQITDAMDITPPSVTRGTYTKSPMGSDTNTPVAGRLELGDFSFSVYFDPSDASHSGLEGDDKETENTYVIEIETGSAAKTYYAFDGFVTSANLVVNNDGLTMLEVTVALTTDVTSVDDS